MDATSRKISQSNLVGSGRGGSFKRPIIGGLNQPLLMLRAGALALRARLRELMSLREIFLIAQIPLLIQGACPSNRRNKNSEKFFSHICPTNDDRNIANTFRSPQKQPNRRFSHYLDRLQGGVFALLSDVPR